MGLTAVGSWRRACSGAGLCCVLALVSACSARLPGLGADEPSLAGPAVELEQVPFFPQQQYQCGPAALATVLENSGVAVTPQQLAPGMMIPARKGSLQIELQAQARAHGRVPYPLQGDMAAIYAELAAGQPVLVLQNLALSWAPVWHYAVVVGVDPAARTVTLRSGRELRRVMDLRSFERSWAAAEHWALVVVPATQLPVTAVPEGVLKVAADLEQLALWSMAESWYQSAAQRWPQRAVFTLGVANAAYAQGELAKAEAGYRQAIERFPDDAAAYNNLAWLLAEQGRWGEAETLIERGLRLGGPLQAELLDTRQHIRCRGEPGCQ